MTPVVRRTSKRVILTPMYRLAMNLFRENMHSRMDGAGRSLSDRIVCFANSDVGPYNMDYHFGGKQKNHLSAKYL